MVIMGIDSSTNSTGWGVINTKYTGSMRLIGYGTITPKSSKDDYIDKIINIVKELNYIIEDYNPEMVIIEEMNVARNMKTARILSGLITSIEIMLRKKEYLYEKLTPSQWRKGVEIKGKTRQELKNASQIYVVKNYNEIVKEDEADAICIAEAGSFVELEG